MARIKGLFYLLMFASIFAACGGGSESPSQNTASTETITAVNPSKIIQRETLSHESQIQPGQPVNLPRTGQMKTYATDDDGEIKQGIPWPDPRFKDNANGTVSDHLTGLIWLKNANCFGRREWAQALIIANQLANGQCGLSDGSNAGDWRLPNRKELHSLIDFSKFNPALPAGHPFTDVQTSLYWSSSTYAHVPSSAWGVDILSGDVYAGFEYDPYLVWPVRSGKATAPAAVPKTGQIKSYKPNDDGDLKNGVAWPDPRILVDGTGHCVIDKLTGLMWIRTPDSTTRTWTEAIAYADGLVFCGYDDWRLPNVNELESLINLDAADTSLWLNTQGFNALQADYYWASSTFAGLTNFAWVVNIYSGNVYTSYKTSTNSVLPVRAGIGTPPALIQTRPTNGEGVPVALPSTGQTTCYDAAGNVVACPGSGRQDGELQRGVPWPSPRFSDNGNGTIKDNLTDLIWLKNANCFGVQDWVNALKSSNALKSGECGLTDGSMEGDWHLPNRKELRSLINYGQTNTAIWLIGQGFPNVQLEGYWSSSTYAYDQIWAFAMSMVDGGVCSTRKTVGYFVWPVRIEGGTHANLTETGQKSCYNLAGAVIPCLYTGQDGDIHAGVAWPDPRFTDNGNGTLTDNLTGLIWLKNANCFGKRTWVQALSDANGLANGSCGLTDGSSSGNWRLPNINEVESLFTAEEPDNAIWMNDQGFINPQIIYWSSTTYTQNPANAWHIISDGIVDAASFNKADASYVLPVRDATYTP